MNILLYVWGFHLWQGRYSSNNRHIRVTELSSKSYYRNCWRSVSWISGHSPTDNNCSLSLVPVLGDNNLYISVAALHLCSTSYLFCHLVGYLCITTALEGALFVICWGRLGHPFLCHLSRLHIFIVDRNFHSDRRWEIYLPKQSCINHASKESKFKRQIISRSLQPSQQRRWSESQSFHLEDESFQLSSRYLS